MHLHLVEPPLDEDMPNTEKLFPAKSSEAIEDVALTKSVSPRVHFSHGGRDVCVISPVVDTFSLFVSLS